MADDVGLIASDQHRGRPGHGVEVAAGDFLVSACIQNSKDIPYLDFGDGDGGHEPVAVATTADDIGLVHQRRESTMLRGFRSLTMILFVVSMVRVS